MYAPPLNIRYARKAADALGFAHESADSVSAFAAEGFGGPNRAPPRPTSGCGRNRTDKEGRHPARRDPGEAHLQIRDAIERQARMDVE
jgi:hypothetical protein